MSPPDLARPPFWLSLAAAVLGGVLFAGAFPGLGWWPLALPGVALLLFSTAGRTIPQALATGLLGGSVFWGIHIFWSTVYLGPIPWLALGGLQTLFFAAAAVLCSLAWTWAPRTVPGPWGSLVAAPLLVAGIWSLRESITSVWPYGGFSWGRIAFSQSEGWFADTVAWVGATGLGFLLAVVATLLVQTVRAVEMRPLARILPPIALAVLIVAVPGFPGEVSGSIRIAAVQGNSNSGLFADYVRGEILQDHLAATRPLYGEDVDLIVWPENASDIDPLRSTAATQALDHVTTELNAPLIVGTITRDADDRTFNSVLLWERGQGATQQYDKMHPVPFAEYLPDREFWYPFAPDLFDMVPRDYSFGERPNVFALEGAIAGIAICFDIVDDGLIALMIDSGADIILAPTNNADFGRTDESAQQLAIARIRAIETHRSVVNISTVGTSAIIAPDGRTIEQLPTFEAGHMLQDVALSTTTTPATVIGGGLGLALNLLTVFALLGLGLLQRTALRRRAALGRRPGRERGEP